MSFPHIRAPWLRTFADRLTRRERPAERHRTMREVYQSWLVGLDLELPLPLPHYADVLGVANDNLENTTKP